MPTSITPHDVRHGRIALKVTDIPSAGWKDILWRTFSEVSSDHVLLIAAGVTFYALLALVPAMTALVSIYGIFADPGAIDRQMALLVGFVPGEGLEIVREQLRRLTEQGTTKLGLTSLIALVIALWSANAGMKSMFEAMNVAYDEEEKRSFLRLTMMTLAFTLASIATIVISIGLVLVLPVVLRFVGLGALAQWASRIGGLALVLGLMIAGLAALYRWGPSRHEARWRWITPGALLAIVVILITSILFTWYAASFGSYNATYGSLGAIFSFMTWLWIMATIVIVGAELNSEIEHQTARDTTTGAPRPMGERGAVMADTLGQTYGSAPEFESPSLTVRSGKERHLLDRAAILAMLVTIDRWAGRRHPFK